MTNEERELVRQAIDRAQRARRERDIKIEEEVLDNRARTLARINIRKLEGFDMEDKLHIRCEECGEISNVRTTHKFRKHKPGCSVPNRLVDKKQIEREKRKRKRQRRIEKLGTEELNAKERKRYRRGLAAQGWILKGELIICPLCRFVGKPPAPWRHYVNCPSELGGRRVSYPKPLSTDKIVRPRKAA